ncbi:MAG: hypothetical protein AAFO89_03540 [Planctomycetota bacterium]
MEAVVLGMMLLLPLGLGVLIRLRWVGDMSWVRRCTRCDYSLDGLGSGACCPECRLERAGIIEPPVHRQLVVSPARRAFSLRLLACLLPVVAVNASGPVWTLLYLRNWGRVPIDVIPSGGFGSLAMAIIALPLVCRVLRPWKERGVGLAVLLSAAGFWLAQPFGVLFDWHSNGIQPGGPGMPVASSIGLVFGFAVARIITARRAMLRLRRIRTSRAARSNTLASPPLQPSPQPPGAPPTTPSLTPIRRPST